MPLQAVRHFRDSMAVWNTAFLDCKTTVCSYVAGDWKRMLWDALHAAAPPTPFACSAHINNQRQQVPLQYPEVSVSGVGLLKLPLPADQAAGLKAVAQQAPHGKGMETVVDTTVRDALQVSSGPVQRGEPLKLKHTTRKVVHMPHCCSA